MKQIVQGVHSGKIRAIEVPVSRVGPKQVLVKNAVSVISAGTERAMSRNSEKSLLEKAWQRPALVNEIVEEVQNVGIINTIAAYRAKVAAVSSLGYSCAGTVMEVNNAPGLKPGDRVACAGFGYASHAEYITVPQNLCVKIPEGVEVEEGAFATLGAISLQGLRVADLRLGERVVVIGLGLIGLITIQLVKAAGCSVLATDLDSERVAKAVELGADLGMATGGGIIAAAQAFTQGRGADAVIITAAAASNLPTELAGQLARLKGRIVFVGDVKMDIPRETYYKKELEVRLSMSYGPGRYDRNYEEKGLDYPYAYVPFTEQRNMETFLNLVREGKITPGKLISHRFALTQAEAAYALITGKAAEPYLGVVFHYPQESETNQLLRLKEPEYKKGTLSVGVIGAGSYAKQMLLPILQEQASAKLIGLATASGLSSWGTGGRFDFSYCTTDYQEILRDNTIEAVVIATRHNTHAALTREALSAGKHVFVEKPLAMNEQELQEIISAVEASGRQVVVGFNRRFSPLGQEARRFFAERSQPLTMLYRVNAGRIGADHWVQDEAEGGGRIVGEMCHFIDFMQFVCGARPVEVYAAVMEGNCNLQQDNVSAIFKFADGSMGALHYFANGDKSLSKEYIEIYGEGKIFRIDDFRKGWRIEEGRVRELGKKKDKGQTGLLKAFCEGILTGKPAYELSEAVYATLGSFRLATSLNSGKVERI